MSDANRRVESIAVAGSSGVGLMTAGELLLESAGRAGWYGLMSRSSGPQIRRGEAAALLRIGTRPISSHGDTFDFLVVLDGSDITRFVFSIGGNHSLHACRRDREVTAERRAPTASLYELKSEFRL